MAVDREIEVAISQSIIDETLRVLRDKFEADAAELANTSEVMQACGTMVHPTIAVSAVKDDPNDNHVVECALAAGAEAIVTGDNDLLRMGSYEGITMLRIGEFLRRER